MKLLVIPAFFAATLLAQDFKLPPPFATPSARNNSKVVDRPAGAKLTVPPGFSVEEFITGIDRPRTMILGPSNELLITDSSFMGKGAVYVVPDPLHSPNPLHDKNKRKLIEGLSAPFGLAFWKDYLYVGEPTSIKRYKYDAKAMTAGAGEEVVSLKDFGSGHNTRNLLFDRKGEKMYVEVGSQSNVNAGEDPLRAAVNRYNPDGSGHEVFVSGTRNPTGIHLYPGSDTIWITVEERDELGDDLVPEYFTHIEQGRFYGWPYAYLGPNEDPRRKGERPDLVAKTTRPDVLLPAHSSATGFTFYSGKMFPAEYQGGAFIALHGSWNRALRQGYEIRFVPFKNGKPAGEAKSFLTGWMIAPDKAEVWGRPVSALELPDGSLLVSDDGGHKIWRVTYK